MKKYIVYAPHKCGSTIISKILADLLSLTNCHLPPRQEIIFNNDSNKAKLQFEQMIQLPKPASNVDFNKDDFIFIPRNPIGISISMFYSFGYTHNCPPHRTEEEFNANRKKIQNLGLHQFVKQNAETQFNKIEGFWNFPTANKTILPYEFMVDNFSKFLKELLQSLDMVSAYDKIYKKWKTSFNQIEDKSDLIVIGESKDHKRTTDIHEWKKKLSNEERSKYLSRFPFIQQYDDFLNEIL